VKLALVTNVCTHYRRPFFEAVAERFDAHFYFTSGGQEWYQPSFSNSEIGTFHAVFERRPLHLARALIRGRYDCVVVSLAGRSTLLAAVAAARLARRPLVLWVGIWQHPTTAFHRLSRPLARRLYSTADALIVYGPHVARYLAAESGREEGIFQAPQAVDNDFFRNRVNGSNVGKLRARLQEDDSAIGCFVGRLEREKGLEILLRALVLTVMKQKLLLIGSGSHEPDLRARAAELGISDRILFAGKLSQEILPEYLRATDFLVLPSITTSRFKEPWGLVVNEAMNSGLPVIASDAVGAAAGGLVVDQETGRVVPEGDPVALAAAMDELAMDESKRLRLGARGAERVQSWSFDAAADAFERAIFSAVKRTGANGAGAARP
jgi:glycosyltransferase involved in cell wall biosynthesis